MKVKVWDSIWSDYFNQINQSEFGMRALTNNRLGMRKCVRCRVMNIRTLFLAPGSGLIFKRESSTPESQLPLSRSEEQLAYADRRCCQHSSQGQWWSALFIVFLSLLTTDRSLCLFWIRSADDVSDEPFVNQVSLLLAVRNPGGYYIWFNRPLSHHIFQFVKNISVCSQLNCDV